MNESISIVAMANGYAVGKLDKYGTLGAGDTHVFETFDRLVQHLKESLPVFGTQEDFPIIEDAWFNPSAYEKGYELAASMLADDFAKGDAKPVTTTGYNYTYAPQPSDADYCEACMSDKCPYPVNSNGKLKNL